MAYGPGDRPGGTKTVKVKAHTRTVKVKAPTQRQVANANAQRQQYVSQGRAVQKVAQQQKQAVRVRQSQVKDTKGNADMQRGRKVAAQGVKQVARDVIGKRVKDVNPSLLKNLSDQGLIDRHYKNVDFVPEGQLLNAIQAPALKVMGNYTRPLHAFAGGANAQVKLAQQRGVGYALFHDNPAARHAALRGLENKDLTTFSDVLKTAGVHNKLVRGIGGFALDTAGDPLLPLTGGLGGVAERAGALAARQVEARAVKAGMSEAGQATVARAATKRAVAAAPAGRGVALRYAGMEIPGSRRATAAVGRGVGKVAGKVPGAGRAAQGVRNVVREVRPQMAPAGADRAQYEAARKAASRARSAVNTADQRAHATGRALKKAIGAENFDRVVAHIEAGTVGKLRGEPQLHEAAVRYRSDMRHALRVRRQAGERIGEVGGKTSRLEHPAPRNPPSSHVIDTGPVPVDPAVAKAVERHNRKATQKVPRRVRNIDGQLLTAFNSDRYIDPAPLEAQRAAAFDAPRGGSQSFDGQRTAPSRRSVVSQPAGAPARIVVHRYEPRKRLTARTVTTPNRGTKGYVPHATDTQLREGLGLGDTAAASLKRTGRTIGKEGSAKVREDKAPIGELNVERAAQGLDPLSTDLPLLKVNYDRQTGRVAAQGNFLKRLADSGRELRRGQALNGQPLHLKPGESVYRLGGKKGGQWGLHPVSDAEAQAFLNGKAISTGKAVEHGTAHQAGKFVVLNEKVVTDATRASQPAIAKDMPAVHLWDKGTGLWKRVATGTFGFQIRNAIGDTHMAYMEQNGARMPLNVNDARRVLKRNRQMRKAGETVSVGGNEGTGTIKIGGQTRSLDGLVKDLHEHGIFNTGPVARDVTDTLAVGKSAGTKKVAAVKGVKGAVNRGTRHVSNFLQDREAAMRIATAVEGLRRGMSMEDAAALSRSVHIDYGDLSGFEREVGRRVAPFYTFTARSTPFHLKKMVTNPGKVAQYQKVREEAAKAQGFSDTNQQDKGLTEYQQRQAPLVISIGGHKHVISWGDPLAAALNETPQLSAKYLDELGQTAASLLNPAIRTPIELYTNKSFFFRSDIESAHGPLVAAPSWVQHLPDRLKKKWGVVPDLVDKKTGKKIWGWRGKAGYVSSQVMPGAIGQINDLAAGTNRRGQTGATKVISKLGVKVDPYDPVASDIGREYPRNDQLYIERAKFNQRGIKADNATPEYKKLSAAIKVSDQKLHAMSVQRKDVIPLKRNVAKGGGRKSSGGGMPIFKGDSSGGGGMPIFR